jgi:hypothetical protein
MENPTSLQRASAAPESVLADRIEDDVDVSPLWWRPRCRSAGGRLEIVAAFPVGDPRADPGAHLDCRAEVDPAPDTRVDDSSRAWENLVKLRVVPEPGLVALNGSLSVPKKLYSTATIAPEPHVCPAGYSWNPGQPMCGRGRVGSTHPRAIMAQCGYQSAQRTCSWRCSARTRSETGAPTRYAPRARTPPPASDTARTPAPDAGPMPPGVLGPSLGNVGTVDRGLPRYLRPPVPADAGRGIRPALGPRRSAAPWPGSEPQPKSTAATSASTSPSQSRGAVWSSATTLPSRSRSRPTSPTDSRPRIDGANALSNRK